MATTIARLRFQKVGNSKQPVTTLRSTSGAGFDFEDQISAWLQVKMLSGEAAPAINGQITQIQAQVSAIGWQIDDLLVTAADDSGTVSRLAISAKGNQQVTQSGLPTDFVELVWNQWRNPATPMQRNKDALALVKRGAHPVFDSNWQEVKNACSGSDATLALERMKSAPRQSKIFNSLRKSTATPADATDRETVELIRHLHVISADFQLDHSDLKNGAVSQCRRLLTNPDPIDAENLWNELVRVGSKIRIQTGSITLDELWTELRKQFRFQDHPNFAQDWRTLTDLTLDHKSRIQTAFSSGYSVKRSEAQNQLESAIRANLITVVVGDSGAGKSAIIKSTLDNNFQDWTQVWLGPEQLQVALSAAKRKSLPLHHELERVLNASNNAQNLLVLDSAERIDPIEYSVTRKLLEEILPDSADNTNAVWRVVVATQHQRWSNVSETVPVARAPDVFIFEVGPLTESSVKAALLATSTLSWIAAHDEIIKALTNLRVFAWVAKAGTAIGSKISGLDSHGAIADILWDYWTENAADVQAMMMRLAEREAQFERSFAITELSPAEMASFQNRPETLPICINERTNRIEFEHDLAADWSRFQYLKQFATDTQRWAALAVNPLWTSALRMLAQSLLRQASGTSTAWDQALNEAEGAGNTLACDVLLDSLCLDPDAERFLTERADLLFSENARRLNRLMLRFRHMGTIPTGAFADADASLELYVETQFRTVIFGLWPPVLRFMIAHRERLAGLISAPVAQLLETWLNGTPRKLSNGATVSFRKEAAEIALAMARSVQVEKGRGVIYLMDEMSLYTAPLSGAGDLTDRVAAWALEVSGRHDVDAEVTKRISDEISAQAKRQEDLKKSGEGTEKRKGRRKSPAVPSLIGASRRRLPPWPLGGKRPIDSDFRKAAFSGNTLMPLMRADPSVAAEVLLALIVEDEPAFDQSGSRYEIDLGLKFARDGYPTIYWKSPFFQFFQASEQKAVSALIALVEFCTQRWVAELGDNKNGPPPGVTLRMNDGSEKRFTGSSTVFNWVQGNSMRNGNLFCALDALERWLILQLKAGKDISRIIERLLTDSTSSAFIGLLTNVAKFRPELLEDILAPILTDPLVFYWDSAHASASKSKFDTLAWARSGDFALEMAKSWGLAPHRTSHLLSHVVEQINSNSKIATTLKEQIPTWRLPDDPKLALELKIIIAQLDCSNYRSLVDDETKQESFVFDTPEELDSELKNWNEQNQKPLVFLQVPLICDRLLQSQVTLPQPEATKIFDQLKDVDNSEEIEVEQRSTCRVALSAALLVNGEALIAVNDDARKKAEAVVKDVISAVGDTPASVREARVRYSDEKLKYAAYAAMHRWVKNDADSEHWERQILKLLTSGDTQVIGTITAIAHSYRERISDAWWRLLFAGLLWSGLILLKPQFDEENNGALWAAWLERLRRFKLRGAEANAEDLDVLRITNGYQRLDFARQVRLYEAGERLWLGVPERSRCTGLAPDVLGQLFAWLLNGDGTGDRTKDKLLIMQLWEQEVLQQRACGKDDKGGQYGLPSQTLGYDLLSKMAELSVIVQDGSAQSFWMPVLSHGPAAHYSLRHFIQSLFQQIRNGCDVDTFERTWREMVEYALDADWYQRDWIWYHGEELLCDLIGFGHESALIMLPAGVQARMREIYERWASAHLDHEENCLARFCEFLVTPFGEPLRLVGLTWIATALKEGAPIKEWYRDRTGDALSELVNTSINQNYRELATDALARGALLETAAHLSKRGVPAAMALQERIKLLR